MSLMLNLTTRIISFSTSSKSHFGLVKRQKMSSQCLATTGKVVFFWLHRIRNLGLSRVRKEVESIMWALNTTLSRPQPIRILGYSRHRKWVQSDMRALETSLSRLHPSRILGWEHQASQGHRPQWPSRLNESRSALISRARLWHPDWGFPQFSSVVMKMKWYKLKVGARPAFPPPIGAAASPKRLQNVALATQPVWAQIPDIQPSLRFYSRGQRTSVTWWGEVVIFYTFTLPEDRWMLHLVKNLGR